MSLLVGLGIGTLVVLVVVHLALVWMEEHGWIYYRRSPKHGGSHYHLLQLSSVFDPRFQQVIETLMEDERQEDPSGDPPGDDRHRAQEGKVT